MSMRSDKEENLRTWRDQAVVLQGMASGAPLHQVLDELVVAAESEGDGLSCEIWVVDSALRVLTHSAGPHMPQITKPSLGATIEELWPVRAPQPHEAAKRSSSKISEAINGGSAAPGVLTASHAV